MNKLADELQQVIAENHRYEDDRKTMIANISHDLRTPMTSLLGYIEMLKSENQLALEEKAKYLDIIQSKGAFLYELMEDFFQLSKLDFEEKGQDIGMVNISEVIRQNMASFYNDFKKLGIEPEIKMPDEDVYITGNEADMQRILNNLIWNALKYGNDGGHIGVELRNEGSRAIVDVWDKGKGIPEQELPYVFERLYALEKSRNAKLQGSGLGLTIVKKLIEKYNGSIEVTSVPYEKTVFSFNLAKCNRTINE
ncbi:MAG: sensor histidine kinase [Caulobacteraceae bacterium]